MILDYAYLKNDYLKVMLVFCVRKLKRKDVVFFKIKGFIYINGTYVEVYCYCYMRVGIFIHKDISN